MRSTHIPASYVERELAALACHAMGADFEAVSVTLVGEKVLLSGTAPSYTAKARAAETLRGAGYSDVDNCLRVVPGLSVQQ